MYHLWSQWSYANKVLKVHMTTPMENTGSPCKGAREMVQELRALSALIEDQGLIPSMHSDAACNFRDTYT